MSHKYVGGEAQGSSNMAQENQDGGLIRRYLLGRLQEDELEQLEQRLMVDGELFDQVGLAEDEMVDAYVNGELPQSERGEFEASFLSTTEGRQQVAYAKALREHVDNVSTSAAVDDVGGNQNPSSRQCVAEAPLEKDKPAKGPVADESLEGKVIRPSWWPRPELDPFIKLAAAAVIVIGLGLGIWRTILKSQVSKGPKTLAYAYRDQRPFEARISGFDYAPASTTRGGEPKVDKTARNLAENILLEAVMKHPDAATHHDAGRLYLAEKKFDEAIEQFEEALKTDPNNAQIHSDLGAALLEKGKEFQLRGESGKSFENFGRSSEHLSKAVDLKPLLLEALFNRALCKEYLLLYRGALDDWNIYLQKDPNSRWADEARQKIRELEDRPQQQSKNKEELFDEFRNAFRTRDDDAAWHIIATTRDSTLGLIGNKLIDGYLALAVRREVERVGALEALSYAGQLERKRANDCFLANLCEYYRRATPSQLEGVVQARNAMKRARESSFRNNFDEALALYEGARQQFERAGDEYELMYAAFPIANCYLQQSRAEKALSLLEPLAQAAEKYRCKRLLAQTLDTTANANLYLRDFSSAMDCSKRSIDLSKEIGDSIGFLNTSYQLAEEYRYVSNPKKALDLHSTILVQAYKCYEHPVEFWPNYFSLSLTLYQLAMPATAVDYQREALQLAISAERPRIVCRSYNYLGMLLARNGNYSEAAASVEKALEIGNSFTEEKVRVEAIAPSFLQLGYINRRLGNIDKAIKNYDQAIQSYDDLDSKFFDYTARKDKLLCCMEEGGCDSVEGEMEALLTLFEEHRSKILEESNRNTFFDGEQSIYDMAIEFEYFKKGNEKQAFQHSERSRGRSFADLMKTNVTLVNTPDGVDLKFNKTLPPMSLEDIQRGLPDESEILQYAVLKSHTIIWLVNKNRIHHVPVTVSVEVLNTRVKNFLRLIAAASDDESAELSNESNDLYDLLIKPVEEMLARDKELCIVPDKILNYLPFAALKSRDSNRYFVEQQERGLVLSPSSSLFVTCSEDARRKDQINRETLLIVGDPVFNHNRFPDLNLLQGAAREARTIAGLYQSPDPLVGASATKRRVMSQMANADVIHLATHAVLDPWHPFQSKLLLSEEPVASRQSSDGVLQASDIYGLDLHRARLVVLSACQTGVEAYLDGEGMLGLSRPFIAKGIPLVVASLWRVDSAPTADLMISFHRHRTSGKKMPTAEALRLAQIEMLKDTGSRSHLPYYWAPFVTMGGNASF